MQLKVDKTLKHFHSGTWWWPSRMPLPQVTSVFPRDPSFSRSLARLML